MRLQDVVGGNETGFSIAMGYLDGDRFADLVIGAPGQDAVYVFFGGVDPGFGGLDPNSQDRSFDLANADVVINGTAGTMLGFSVAIGPRLPSDPANFSHRLIVGAPAMDDPNAPGEAYVVLPGVWATATSPVTIASIASATLMGEQPGDTAGYAVAIGPVLAAGTEDFVVGARRAQAERGAVYVAAQSSAGATPLSMAASRFVGSVDGEGLGEFVVVGNFIAATAVHEIAMSAVGTAPDDNTNPPGRVYVLPAAPGTTNLDMVAGRRIQGDGSNDFFGFSLAAGDFDRDNLLDLAVGAIYADTPIMSPSKQNSGAVYVFDNGDLSALPTSPDPNMIVDAQMRATHIIEGNERWDELGFGMSTGNIDNVPSDPNALVDDLVVSARWHDRAFTADKVDEGAIYVLLGDPAALSSGWPTSMICASPECMTDPIGVGSLVFGGNFEFSASDQAGFSIAAGDFNHFSVFDDIAISSIAHDRVYLVSINSQDSVQAADGQMLDLLRDIRDKDDDGDGYLDTEEDAVPDGLIDPVTESDPLVPNRDAGVVADPNTLSVDCDNAFTVTVEVENASRTISIDRTQLRLRVDIPSIFTYDPNTTTITDLDTPGSPQPVADLGGSPFFPFSSYATLPSTPAFIPEGKRYRIQFQVTVGPNPLVTTGTITANVDPATIMDELAETHVVIMVQPNMDDLDVSLLCPDLTVAKTDNPDPVIAGETLTYALTITNNGTADALNVTASDPLSMGLVLDPNTVVPPAACSSDPNNVVTCDLGTIPWDPNGVINTGQVSFVVNVDSGVTGPINNTVTVSSGNDELNDGNNTGMSTTTVARVSDMQVTKTDGLTVAAAGDMLTYAIEVRNNGPSDVAMAPVTDTFDPTFFGDPNVNVSWTCSVMGVGSCGAANGTGNISTTVDLKRNARANFVVQATTLVSATGTVSNTAMVGVPGGTADPDPNNDTATDNDTQLQSADLAITKTDSLTTAAAGDTLNYTIEVTNNGPSDVTGAAVADTFNPTFFGDPNMNVSWTCGITGTGACGDPNGIGDIATTVDLNNGAVATFMVQATTLGSATGTVSNTAMVTAPGGTADPNTADNTATDSDTTLLSADLAITKDDGQISVVAGTPLTYTITVTNNGPSSVTGAAVADTFDPTFFGDPNVNVSWTCGVAGTGACGDPNGIGDIATTVNLDPNDVATYTVQATTLGSASGMTVSNTATVAPPAGTSDPVGGNNSATDSDTGLTLVNSPPTGRPSLALRGDRLEWTTSADATSYNVYRGNLGVLRSTGIYTQDPASVSSADRFCWVADSSFDDSFTPAMGEVVFYLVSVDDGVSEGSLGQNSAGEELPISNGCR